MEGEGLWKGVVDCSSKKSVEKKASRNGVSLRLKQSIKRHRASTGETEIAISRLSVMCDGLS